MSLLKPTRCFDKLTDISVEEIKKFNVETILLDIDNTLTVPDSKEPFDGVLNWLKEMEKEKFKLLIISNNTKKRVESFAKTVNLRGIYHAKKPMPFKVKKAIGKEIKKTLMVGDQIFTDVLLANLSGMKSILLNPQAKDPEILSFKIKRKVEKFLKKNFIKNEASSKV